MDTERAGAPSPRTHPPPPTDHAKLDQLVQHFYAKTCAVVSQARSTHLAPPADDYSHHPLSPALGAASTAAQPVGSASSPVPPQGQPRRASATGKDKLRRTNKWFNLELPDSDQFRTELKTWRNLSRLVVPVPSPSSTSSSLSRSALSGGGIARGGPSSSSSAPPPVPPMILDVVLDTSDLSPNQVLVLADQRGKRLRVSAPTRRARPAAHDVQSAGGRASPVPRPRSAGAGLGHHRPSSAAATSSVAAPAATVAPDVVLERWVLSLSPRATSGTSASTSSSISSPSTSSSTSYPSPSSANPPPPPPAPPTTTTATELATELPTVYKHAILHFRAQFTLARTLPAWALHRRLVRRPFATAAAGGTGLGLRVRMGRGEGVGGGEGGEEEREGEVGIEEALEGGEGETERIVFPGIETPLGTLSLSVTYRLNTDFSVEEIETLLSSRFIDEDFFRPTVARYPSHVQHQHQQSSHPYPHPQQQQYQYQSHALRTEPGSLPLTSTSPGGGLALGGGASRMSPPVAAPASSARGMTGLGPLPSYGSLSSRHPYAPHGPPLPPPATTTPHAPSPLSSSPRPSNALPAPVAVPRASHTSSASASPRPSSYMSAGGASPSASHSSSAPRFAAYVPAPSPASAAAAPSTSTSAGANAVEPAFISLARARGASYSGVGGGSGMGSGSVPRASPLSASPAAQAGGFFRRASGGSSSSGGPGGFYGAAGTSAGAGGGGGGGSPIFRAGSYLGTSALASSSSPSGAPIGRQQPLPLPVAVPAPAGAHPQLSGSPLTGGSMSARPGLGSYGSQGSYTRSGILRASSASGGSGSFDEAHPHPHAHHPGQGSAIVRRPSGGAASRALSFGVAGSLGRSPGVGGGGALTSGGAAAGSSGVSRLGTMMAQYDAASAPAARVGAGAGSGGGAAPAAERRRFVHEGRAPDDADDIEAFLGMLDSKPDLRASDAGGGLGGGLGRSSVAGGGFVSKRDIDEQLRLLRSSVYGAAGSGSAGSGGESPSPPVLFGGGSAGWAGPSGVSPSPRTSSGLSSLRRQTSRLSIEEDPAAEAAAVAARSPSRERPATVPERTPRAPLRTLYGHGHGRASPTLSATSGTSTAIPPLPQPSTGGVEPRFLPLPLSSTTSPLASPGAHGTHPHYHHHALQSAAFGAYPFAALAPQPYPPLPYPPAAAGSTADAPSSAPPEATTAASEPVTIAPMRPSSAGAAARGGSSAVAYHQMRRGVSSTTQPTTPALGSEHTSAAASIASFDVDADADGGAESSSSYRAEEEPVGRLELDDSEEQPHDAQLQLEAERRGRWGGALGGEADEEEIARLHSHSGRAAPGRHSRDATPAATRLGGGGSSTTAPATGYFARGAGGGGVGSSPPEISWMG
ncbi:hypothetical protein JCM8208_007069 [Rhodotorula glutinis]